MEIYTANAIRWINTPSGDPQENANNLRRIAEWWESQAGRSFKRYHTADAGADSNKMNPNTGKPTWEPAYESFTDLGEFVASNPSIKLHDGEVLVYSREDAEPIRGFTVDVVFDKNLLIVWFGAQQQTMLFRRV